MDYDIKSPSQIHDIQQDFINDTSAILGESSERCAILLRYFKWNKERLIENYLERRGRTLELAGLDTSGAFSQPKAIAGFMCDICCDDDEGLQTFALKCDHRFCTDCYGRYLSQKIIEEGEAANITCPGEKCTMIVDSHTVKLMVKANVLSRYAELLDKAFIDSQNDLRWCSGPDCDKAIMCPVKKSQLRTVVPTVTCQCDFSFCFGCSREDHMPTPCYLVKLWLKKCADDSETANWISANTKECPVCSSTIEKNGGCNHMTCRKWYVQSHLLEPWLPWLTGLVFSSKGEFCWICMGKWSEHGTAWYNCNRFEEKSGLDARDAQAKSRHSLDRYLHYYNRYHNHDISGRQDRALYEKTQTKMSRLQASSGLSWIEVQFLSSAQQVLQQCRATLKWTYAFAFYLEQNNMTHIFESNQADLEMAVENLSEMFGKKEAELRDLKVEIMDRTSYCGKRRIILLSDTACNLNDGESAP